ncbi:unnamed protein product [Mytilus coruscus]|uniref:DUF4371 domain-containing protein n=1 Tax=Mytilus coruscus TaxID=42192 RepID=A0A6J8A1D5_MYTCO|nr:unnamed protein product [Mytilus coruscus]
MFRTCHAMVKNNRPLSDFNWMCQLDEMKGLLIGNTYRNSSSAKTFIRAIAETEFNKVLSIVQRGKFLCLIGGGSTDSSVKEQEMWYLRTSIAGQVSVQFLGVKNVERASAENIVNGIKDLLTVNLGLQYLDIMKKTVALSCNGASVMVGCRAGVGAILRWDQPSMLTVHCMAHRLELSLKDASKKIKLFEKTISTLAMGFFDAAVKSDEEKLLMPTRAGGKRWVGHLLLAVTNLITSYKFIIAHLGQLTEPIERVSVYSKARAIAFLKLLKSKNIVCFLLFLVDVLKTLRHLSLKLQDRKCLIADQYSALSSTIEILTKYKTSDGPHLHKVIDKTEFQGVKLTFCNNVEFIAARQNLLDKLLESLDKRFSKLSSSSIVQATLIADLQIWPKSWEALKEDAELEWTLLKKDVHDLLGQDSRNSCLAIKLLSPEIHLYDPVESINLWNGSCVRSRRPTLKDNSGISDQILRLEVETDNNVENESVGVGVVEPHVDVVKGSDAETMERSDHDVSRQREIHVNAILNMMERVREECCDNECGSGLDDEEYESDGMDESTVYSKLLDQINCCFLNITDTQL